MIRLKRGLRAALMLMLGLLGALGLTELGVRFALDPHQAAVARAEEQLPRWGALIRAGLFAYSPDPELHYTLQPGFSGAVEGIRYEVNALGLRGPEVAPKSDALRLVLIGDSYAFGLGASQAETVSAALQQSLQAELKKPVEVLNMGVPAYHTGQEAQWLRTAAPALKPDGVVCLYFGNDASEPAYHLDPQAGHLYTDESATPYRWKRWLHRSTLYQLWAERSAQTYAQSGAMTAGQGVTWPLVEQRLATLKGVCEQQGWPLLIVNLPTVRPAAWTRDAERYRPDLDDAARVTEWGAEQGVPVVELKDWLHELAQQGRLDGLLVSSESGIDFDDHFVGAGNRLMAAWIAREMLQLGFLGLP